MKDNELMEEIFKKFEEDHRKENADEEQVEHEFECLLEAMASDDDKIMAMGESIAMLCTAEKFTAFEMVSMCATLIVSACRGRAIAKGVESTKVFHNHMMESLDETVKETLKEIEDNDKCKDGDCNCEC